MLKVLAWTPFIGRKTGIARKSRAVIWMYSFVFFKLFWMRDDKVSSVHNIPSSPFIRDTQQYSFDQERNRKTIDPIVSKGEENEWYLECGCQLILLLIENNWDWLHSDDLNSVKENESKSYRIAIYTSYLSFYRLGIHNSSIGFSLDPPRSLKKRLSYYAVSYTHLTLPTIYSV